MREKFTISIVSLLLNKRGDIKSLLSIEEYNKWLEELNINCASPSSELRRWLTGLSRNSNGTLVNVPCTD